MTDPKPPANRLKSIHSTMHVDARTGAPRKDEVEHWNSLPMSERQFDSGTPASDYSDSEMEDFAEIEFGQRVFGERGRARGRR